ncbi:methyltransferase domain-containing protein [Paenibacillus sp. KN14-4R]|uniref:methyltransferase domain-containing protein n=1 Tax=Paenibacillus sp. KN14-4R TaxID=3445773 RepID=UPI003F9F4899
MNQVKIGRFIAKMRKQQNLTQCEFADTLGISDKTVSKWECGNGMPELSLMMPICEILQINLNELFSGEMLTDSDYKKKAEENIMKLIEEAEKMKKNIVGGKVLGKVANIDMNVSEAHKTNIEFWNTIGSEFLGVTALPSWGGYLPSEEKLNLLGDLSDKSVLEIGCGNGHSLKYVADLGSTDLWGLDISANQILRTENYLQTQGISAKLICSSMEDECGLPIDYFDLVYSVYGIGWTTSLDKTFKHIHSYLKKDGVFVFGWSHPIHKCVSVEDDKLVFSNSYFNEEWYCAGMSDKEIMLSNRMLSTYINSLARNGFVVEELIEETDKEKAMASDNDFGKKALMLPTAFAIKARKL